MGHGHCLHAASFLLSPTFQPLISAFISRELLPRRFEQLHPPHSIRLVPTSSPSPMRLGSPGCAPLTHRVGIGDQSASSFSSKPRLAASSCLCW